MKQILGKFPITSIIGYVIAGLSLAQTLIPAWTDPVTHSVNWIQVLIGVAAGALGRNAADGNNTVTKS